MQSQRPIFLRNTRASRANWRELKVLLCLSHDKPFRLVDWLQNREFPKLQEAVPPTANQYRSVLNASWKFVDKWDLGQL